MFNVKPLQNYSVTVRLCREGISPLTCKVTSGLLASGRRTVAMDTVSEVSVCIYGSNARSAHSALFLA